MIWRCEELGACADLLARFKNYAEILKKDSLPPGHPIPIQRFYFEFVMSLQSKVFFQDMDKGKFRGYTLDQFAVDVWRCFQAGTGGTSKGYALQLRPRRNNSLWLIDSDGEKRQITSISLQKAEPFHNIAEILQKAPGKASWLLQEHCTACPPTLNPVIGRPCMKRTFNSFLE